MCGASCSFDPGGARGVLVQPDRVPRFPSVDSLARSRARDELRQPASARFVALGAHDPEGHEATVAGRLPVEEGPGLAAGAEALFHLGRELHVAVLERVEADAPRVALLEGIEAGLRHPPRGSQPLDLADVDRAPHARGLTRREALLVGKLVVALREAVDPAEAQGFVHGFLVAHALAPAVLLPEADPELRGGGVVTLEPAAERGGRGEELRGGLVQCAIPRGTP